MDYKILVYGKNPVMVNDFIYHTNVFFKAVSTTSDMKDILIQFSRFKPDGFLCFINDSTEKIIPVIYNLHQEKLYNGAPIFIVTDPNASDAIEEKVGMYVNSTVRRPISFDNLTLHIIRYFEEHRIMLENAREHDSVLKKRQEEAKAEEEAIRAKKAQEEREEFLAAAAARTSMLSKGKKHILVVDDDRTILKMLKDALQDKYEVTAMANGIMVEKFLATKNVDMIILDYEMPVETGADVFRKIKKNPNYEKIPVCFLTGITEREKILEVMSLRPHGYLLKPLDMNMLMSTIRNLIG